MQEKATVPRQLLDALHNAKRVLVFTGAGMSAESGIPTFRDALTGYWSQFDPHQLASPEGWRQDKARVWAWYEWRRGLVSRAQPHAGHVAVAQLARALSAARNLPVQVNVLTQNVDDLHERAGSNDVQHLHGSLFQPRCANCGRPAEFSGPPPDLEISSLEPPHCSQCGGSIRPGVVWFGEDLPGQVWSRSHKLVLECDVLLVVGTSGVVYPAAALPLLARSNDKWVAEINPEVSELSSEVQLHWATSAASGLSSLVNALQAV